ncbi:glutamyl-tRNA reductase [Psychromicrobium lacuslunae]|uniref:glutamyl-tRNA reductase n=1 Tax=Psychromicrobium lacuslunae TaxID=1618207 RepID=UPI0009E5D56F|nr:glutamyl-tRNA reductase [Psychromicrobium lacuslunae]
MVLFSLIATHTDLDLETVARLSVGSSAISNSAVVLATCNRFEIYAAAESEAAVPALREEIETKLRQATELSEELISKAFTTLSGSEVARHLFAVASGLDSAVVGEREIAGQVRRALSEAQTAFPVPGPLVRLFQKASKTAKDVGSQTALGSQGRSIVSVALDLANDSSALSWAERSVLLFGTGAYAGATMALLRERGVQDVSVHSSSGRAPSFVASRGGRAILDATELKAALGSADLVIGCSGSDNRLSAGFLAEARQQVGHSGEQLTMIDLALTRDFDPAVVELPEVELLTLESVRLAAPEEQESALQQASQIVDTAAAAFETEIAARSVDSAIVALRKHTLAVLDVELERVRAQHGCTAAAEEVEFALRRMVKQLLHVPTVRGRELAAAGQQDQYLAGLQALYGLEVATAASPAAIPGNEPAVTEPSGLTSQSAEASCPVDHERTA